MKIFISYFAVFTMIYGVEYLYYFNFPTFDNDKLKNANQEFDDL